MGQRILVVDDEPNVIDILRHFFSSAGYEVIATSRGSEVLDLIAQSAPDVVLLDMIMPDLNGLEACTKLRTGEKTKHLPIILMTGVLMASADALKAGADDLLLKPFRLDDLRQRVEWLIRHRHITDALERNRRYREELAKQGLTG